MYLVVEYVEEPVDHVPVAGDPSGGTQPTRIEESFAVRYEPADPCRSHAPPGTTCGTCGESHPIAIAKLTFGRSGWSARGCGRMHDVGRGRRRWLWRRTFA
jgi:hypothetical protein